MIERIFPAETDSLYKIVDFVKQFADTHGFGQELAQVELAVEEVFVNIVSYAYGEEKGTVRIVCEIDKSTGAKMKKDNLRISFMDTGIPYDPLNHTDPDITLSATEREIGGLGIFLTKEFMDTVSYEYKNGSNILIIEKARKGDQE